MNNHLNTIDGATLMDTHFPTIKYVVDGLISSGLHILAGSPKTCKSWLALDIALNVAMGENMWNFATTKGDVLYLALEDTLQRVQSRVCTLTDNAPFNLHFAINSHMVGNGLAEQIQEFLYIHNETRLIIIDTLQKVRRPADTSYSNDYTEISAIKKIADNNNIAILLIHHVRKATDDCPFNTISGSNGILGSADSAFVLKMTNAHTREAILYCNGRDIESRELRIQFNGKTCKWNFLSDSIETPQDFDDEVIKSIVCILIDNPIFNGTAKELACIVNQYTCKQYTANVIGKVLIQNQDVLAERNITYSVKRTNSARIINLSYKGD